MTMTYDVVLAEMAQARTEVLDLHAEVVKDYTALSKQVEVLLDGWEGRAADSYRTAWRDWLDGALSVIDGLEEMGGLLGLTHSSYGDYENATVDAMHGAATRIRTRLA